MKIRAARAADAPGISACVNAVYAHYVERIGKPPGPMLDDYVAVIKNHAVFVATEDNELAGVVVLVCSADAILLDNVAVAAEKQGRGLGRKLIEFAEAESLRRGYARVDLYTHETMVENIALYKKLGYVETGRRTVKGYRRIYMHKMLR